MVGIELEDYPNEGWKTQIFGADFSIFFIIEDRDGNIISLERDEIDMLVEAKKILGE